MLLLLLLRNREPCIPTLHHSFRNISIHVTTMLLSTRTYHSAHNTLPLGSTDGSPLPTHNQVSEHLNNRLPLLQGELVDAVQGRQAHANQLGCILIVSLHRRATGVVGGPTRSTPPLASISWQVGRL